MFMCSQREHLEAAVPPRGFASFLDKGRKKKKEQKTLSHKQQHELKSHILRVAEISC